MHPGCVPSTFLIVLLPPPLLPHQQQISAEVGREGSREQGATAGGADELSIRWKRRASQNKTHAFQNKTHVTGMISPTQKYT